MIDHLGLQVADVPASKAFYERLLAPLGVQVIMEFGSFVGLGNENKPWFWLGPPTGTETRELHVAFAAPDRATVDAFHQAAVELGAEILHEPRLWPEYHPGYYGAFVRDLDGHNVEAVCHQG